VTAQAIIAELRALGVEVTACDGRLRLVGTAIIPGDLVAAIRERRAEVLALLEAEAGVEEPVPAEVADQAIEQRVEQRVAHGDHPDRPGASRAGRPGWSRPRPTRASKPRLSAGSISSPTRPPAPGPSRSSSSPGASETPGGCVSCGQALAEAYPPRCPACIEAAHRALAIRAQDRPQAAPGGPPEVRTACCPACGQGGAWKRIAGPGEAFCLHCGVVAEPTGPGPPPPH